LNKHNDCEFKHAAKDTHTDKKLSEAKSEINKFKTDVEALNKDVLKLKEDIKKKAFELDKLSAEITKNLNNVKSKDNEISRIKVNCEKALTDKNEEIAKHIKVVENKDIELLKLKAKCDKAVEMKNREISSLRDEIKQLKTSNIETSPKVLMVTCRLCKYVAISRSIIKIHIEKDHELSYEKSMAKDDYFSEEDIRYCCEQCDYKATGQKYLNEHKVVQHR
jgi:dsDNA-specific endonuclease/ATPase MutS2